MASYLGYICNYTNTDEKIPANVNTASHVRVRIPQLHGNPDNREGSLYFTNDQLPWAAVPNPTGGPGNGFDANTYYEDGTVVRVEALNNDLNNLVIGGVFGNYTYTNDTAEISARKANLINSTGVVTGSTETSNIITQSLIKLALKESKNPVNDGGKNNVKYNTTYSGTKVSGEGFDWNCVFIWWLFNECKLSQYFYGGNKTRDCKALLNYHKQHGELTGRDYLAGDLLFMNLNGGNTVDHVEIAVSNLDINQNTIDCVGGDIKDGNGKGTVKKTTRKLSKILYGIRPGTEKCSNRNDPNWKQFDSAWGSDKMVTKTIKKVGCAMTSVSILLRMTGLTETSFNPGVLNKYLKNHSGYVNGNCIVWSAMNNYVDGWKYAGQETLSGGKNTKRAKIKSLLDNGYYVVVCVKNGGHYVAATGYSNSDISMSDPGKNSATLLFETYGDTVSKCIYYSCTNKFSMS